jgi:hypothetical protein
LASPAPAEPIEIASKAVPLNPKDPAQRRVGRLLYRGGLVLTAAGSRFGGLSALRLTQDGRRITFVSDEGSWLTARLVHDERGDLLGLAEAETGRLRGLDGGPLVEKEAADAESLALLSDGSMVVGFEHQHRLLRYPVTQGRPDGVPTVVPPPPGLGDAPPNGGIEALLAWDGGALFGLTEYFIVDQVVRGWVGAADAWRALGYRFDRAYRPSDMARLPGGDVAVLERAYNPERGIVGVRIRRLVQKDVKGGARIKSKTLAALDPPLTVDNFEGIDAVRGADGETLLYLVSDDNFRAGDQRTLLLMFSLGS